MNEVEINERIQANVQALAGTAVEEVASADTKWWNSLSLDQKHHYLKLHPDSKFAKHGKDVFQQVQKQNKQKDADEKEDKRMGAIDAHMKQQTKVARNHLAMLHNSLHSNKHMTNMGQVTEHLKKLSKVIEHVGKAHDNLKPASKAHMDFLSAKPVMPKYDARKAHDPKVASMVHSAKKILKRAHGDMNEGRVNPDNGLDISDVADHHHIGHLIQQGKDRQAHSHIRDLDTSSREQLSNRVWNWHDKRD